MTRHLSLLVLGAACTTLVLASGCGTVTTKSKVLRAPWISFKHHKTVNIQFDVKCDDVAYGPRVVEKSTSLVDTGVFNLKMTGKGLEEEASQCPGPFVDQVTSRVHSEAVKRLQKMGYQVVKGAADATLVADVALVRTRQVQITGTREDTKQNHACAKLCGTPTCLTSSVSGAVHLSSKFSGPDFPEVGPQVVDRRQSWNVYNGPSSPLVCDAGQLAQYRDASKLYNWNGGVSSLAGWLGKSFDRMLLPYTEFVELKLFEVDEFKEAEAALTAAKGHRWAQANDGYQRSLAAYRKAMQEMRDMTKAEPDEDAREVEAQMRYNLAVSTMELGELEAAKEQAITAGKELGGGGEVGALLKELKTRDIDRKKM